MTQEPRSGALSWPSVAVAMAFCIAIPFAHGADDALVIPKGGSTEHAAGDLSA